jgi:hypothetical protein
VKQIQIDVDQVGEAIAKVTQGDGKVLFTSKT